MIAKTVHAFMDDYPHKSHSWLTVYPQVMCSMNRARTKSGEIDPYFSVFGIDWDEPMQAFNETGLSNTELRKYPTVAERCQAVGPTLAETMRSIGISSAKDKDDSNNQQSWESDCNREYSIDYSGEGDILPMDERGTQASQQNTSVDIGGEEQKAATASIPQCTESIVEGHRLDVPHSGRPLATMWDSPDSPILASIVHHHELPEATTVDPLRDAVPWDDYVRENKHRFLDSCFEREMEDGYVCHCLHPFFLCEERQCVASIKKDHHVTFFVEGKDYFDRNLGGSQRALETDFVASFVAMTCHFSHPPGTQLILSPGFRHGGQSESVQLRDDTVRVLTVVGCGTHYAVCVFNLSAPVKKNKGEPRQMDIVIYDGLQYNVEHWRYQLAQLCERCGTLEVSVGPTVRTIGQPCVGRDPKTSTANDQARPKHGLWFHRMYGDMVFVHRTEHRGRSSRSRLRKYNKLGVTETVGDGAIPHTMGIDAEFAVASTK